MSIFSIYMGSIPSRNGRYLQVIQYYLCCAPNHYSIPVIASHSARLVTKGAEVHLMYQPRHRSFSLKGLMRPVFRPLCRLMAFVSVA
jgi:hypothetical protein